jgi:hypothetical protein
MGREAEVLKRLARADLSREGFDEILRDRAARRFHAVRLALAGDPRTPRADAASLVGTLFWRDLAHLSADARVHPEIRRLADLDLLRRLPEMALAERVDLAKIAGRGTLVVLRFDVDPRVIAALLDNRFTSEPDVVQSAARPGARPAVLEVIAVHPRWSLRPAVRSALLRNSTLPLPLGLTLVSRATRDDLEGLLVSPGVPVILRACAERVLADRAGRV